MNSEDAIALVEKVLKQERLTKIQELVFRQSWEGQSYMKIAHTSGYDPGYIKDVGSELWRSLSTASGEKITKLNFRGVLQRSERVGSGGQRTANREASQTRTD